MQGSETEASPDATASLTLGVAAAATALLLMAFTMPLLRPARPAAPSPTRKVMA